MRRGSEVVLQRRSSIKDTFAGYWDASAAGHWRFGETAEEASREIGEELGIDVAFAALEYRGSERLSRSFDNGLIDREHHRVYVLPLDWSLLRYRPDPAEVSALAAVRGDDLLALLAGTRQSVDAVEAVAVEAEGGLTPLKIAVPGELTTAFLALSMCLGRFSYEVVPFDQIFSAVKEQRADAGLIIAALD